MLDPPLHSPGLVTQPIKMFPCRTPCVSSARSVSLPCFKRHHTHSFPSLSLSYARDAIAFIMSSDDNSEQEQRNNDSPITYYPIYDTTTTGIPQEVPLTGWCCEFSLNTQTAVSSRIYQNSVPRKWYTVAAGASQRSYY